MSFHADNFVERGYLVLRNLNVSSLNTSSDTWTSALTGYGFYGVPYEIPLIEGHYYYQRFTYKFTTTNQSPTWSQFYIQGGMVGGPNISNPVAGTEYTTSGMQQIVIRNRCYCYELTSGTLYNGDSSRLSGVSSYAKNVLIYDVTELYNILRSKGTVTSDSTMKTWCDNNLVHKPRYTNYDVSSLLGSNSKVTFKGGDVVVNNLVECDGMTYYSANSTIKDDTYFDNGISFSVYNNAGGGTVTHTRVTDTSSPFYPKHKYVVKITTNGTASPYAGGFVCYHNAKASGIFIETFVAKIPVGYNMTCHYNTQGDGASVQFITSVAGTGKWEEYKVLYKCGSSGSFSSGGHIAAAGSNNTSVTWYVAYCNNCDITGKEYLKYYTAMPNVQRAKGGNLYSQNFDMRNLLPNGILSYADNAMLPNGWSYDTSDYAGNSKRSLVQPVNGASRTFGGYLKIDPSKKYKVSYWVKCKGDMTSFLTAIYPYTTKSNGTKERISHGVCVYLPGTKTTLTSALNSGATSMTVSSNSNWRTQSWSNVGFRSSMYNSSWNDLGQQSNGSGGMISGTSGSNIVTFSTAYTGSTRGVGTVVVEGYDGGNYPYPIQKGSLPTDNTWKYVEGYFGSADTLWDGASTQGYYALPTEVDCIELCLNLYTNNGTVPIKYSDIRVEAWEGGGCERVENKVQINRYN